MVSSPVWVWFYTHDHCYMHRSELWIGAPSPSSLSSSGVVATIAPHAHVSVAIIPTRCTYCRKLSLNAL